MVLLETAQKSFSALVNALVRHPATVAASKIEGRVKDKEECIRKFVRKYQPGLEERNEPYEIRSHVTDLIGLRIVCLYEDEIDQVADILRSHFEVIEVTDKFEAKKVDGFVQYIQEWSPGITRAQFNGVMKENLAVVKRYKQSFEAGSPTNTLNPFTMIRHCLYLADKTTFSKALSKLARESFDAWLGANAPAGPT